jgi:hypothetical protein
MSDNLIERLRADADRWMSGDFGRDNEEAGMLSHDAADEITRLRAELSSLRGEGEPVAYMRKCSFDGDEGTRGNRPRGWKLHAVTKTKVLDDDIPLYAHPTPDSDVIGRLVAALDLLEKAAREVHRKGATSGPQWPKLSGALVRASQALASIPSTTIDSQQETAV